MTSSSSSTEMPTTRPTHVSGSDLSVIEDAEALAADVRARARKLRSLADGSAADPSSQLSVLLGALGQIASKLEARCVALREGEPEAPAAPLAEGAARPAPAPRRGTDPVDIAREMIAGGAGRTEVEDFLRRHFDRAEARRLARRLMRPSSEPRSGRRRES
jgi:hypothetical protein